jgi:ribosomal protein L15E
MAIELAESLQWIAAKIMTGSEFRRKLMKLARERGLAYHESSHGKGDHRTIRFGDRRTTLGDLKKELKKETLSAMCKQLGIMPNDL